MSAGGRLIDAIARAEEALDRLKLRYKERFDRFAPAHITAYRGYGTPTELRLSGRVMEADETGFEPDARIWRRVHNSIRRIETDEIRGARVRAVLEPAEPGGEPVVAEAVADDEAFFQVVVRPRSPLPAGRHALRLEVVECIASSDTGPVTGEVLVPPEDADFLVVSDLDDTVLRSGAQHKLNLARAFLLHDYRTRIPFQGVVEFYRALHAGPDGDGCNPFFYLSRSPWNFYELFSGFLDHHGLPEGPLILRDYGIRGFLGDDDDTFKRRTLREILSFYPDLPAVLIGDSGQRDPEIYRDLALEHPDRIRAVIIRDVTAPDRDAEIHAIARELDAVGVPMILAEDSEDAAEHAARLDLLEAHRLERVRAERASETQADELR